MLQPMPNPALSVIYSAEVFEGHRFIRNPELALVDTKSLPMLRSFINLRNCRCASYLGWGSAVIEAQGSTMVVMPNDCQRSHRSCSVLYLENGLQASRSKRQSSYSCFRSCGRSKHAPQWNWLLIIGLAAAHAIQWIHSDSRRHSCSYSWGKVATVHWHNCY